MKYPVLFVLVVALCATGMAVAYVGPAADEMEDWNAPLPYLLQPGPAIGPFGDEAHTRTTRQATEGGGQMPSEAEMERLATQFRSCIQNCYTGAGSNFNSLWTCSNACDVGPAGETPPPLPPTEQLPPEARTFRTCLNNCFTSSRGNFENFWTCSGNCMGGSGQ